MGDGGVTADYPCCERAILVGVMEELGVLL